MDDMTWCPIPECGSIATVEPGENRGQCQHCEHVFCIDCKRHVHPGKRCYLHRIDLQDEFKDLIRDINDRNAQLEARLNEIYFK